MTGHAEEREVRDTREHHIGADIDLLAEPPGRALLDTFLRADLVPHMGDAEARYAVRVLVAGVQEAAVSGLARFADVQDVPPGLCVCGEDVRGRVRGAAILLRSIRGLREIEQGHADGAAAVAAGHGHGHSDERNQATKRTLDGNG